MKQPKTRDKLVYVIIVIGYWYCFAIRGNVSSDFDSNCVSYRLIWFVLHLPFFGLVLVVFIRIHKNLVTCGFNLINGKQT